MNERELKLWRKKRVMKRAQQSNITTVDPEKLRNEMIAADKQKELVKVEMEQIELFGIITQIQVATSHPMLETAFQKPTIEIGKKLQNQFFEPNSEMWKALELGWPPD
jgi:phosphopantothenoylcysteine synthetase/decarboxylase